MKIKGFIILVEEYGRKANVPISEKSLRILMEHIPELINKDIVWDIKRNKITISYEEEDHKEEANHEKTI